MLRVTNYQMVVHYLTFGVIDRTDGQSIIHIYLVYRASVERKAALHRPPSLQRPLVVATSGPFQ